MKKEFFTGKTVLVMGLGRFGGGVDVAKFACDAGAKVIITDSALPEHLKDSINQLQGFKGIDFHLGSHKLSDFECADIIVVNPAVPPDNEFVQHAVELNKFVTSQINIFFQLCPAKIIGITGSNGKSTTAALTAHLLKNGGSSESPKYSSVWLSGNIGNAPLLTLLDKIIVADLVVLELSSFQTEQLSQIQKAPDVALLTNLTPNHLDRHGTFENYCLAKENIFKYQKSNANGPIASFFYAEDKIAAEWFEKYNRENGRVCIKFSADDVSEELKKQFALLGRVNLDNLAAAVAIAKYFGVEDQSIESCLPEFKALPHRLGLVAQIAGIRWYNDSISTTPQSTIAALGAFEQPRIVIVGGYDKNLCFDELGEKIAYDAKAAILIGQTAPKIADAITKCPGCKAEVEFADSLDDAVNSAKRLAVAGDVVLLSPACASYDMFDNFQQRGEAFIGLVRKIQP